MNTDVVTFLYHEVSDDPNSTGFVRKSNLPYKHKSKEFIENIEAIKESQIIPTTINQIENKSKNHKILLTFDDGGKSAMLIADILERYTWYGHFFITTSMIGSSTFLGKLDIKELFDRGHVLGTHSHNHHTPFRDLSIKEMTKEWSISIDILEQILSSKITCGSIPGGDMDKKSITSAESCNIKYLFTSEPINKVWMKYGIMLFGRVCPKVGTEISKVRNFANNKGFIKEKMVRKIKNLIKFFLGPLYSYYIKIHHSK